MIMDFEKEIVFGIIHGTIIATDHEYAGRQIESLEQLRFRVLRLLKSKEERSFMVLVFGTNEEVPIIFDVPDLDMYMFTASI